MKIKTVTSYLESIAPLSLQEDYDNSGLLIGNSESEVKGILICLDCTEAVIEEAVQKGCNLVIAHHPVIFRGIKRLTESTYVERTIVKAIRKDVAVYAIHTNLDNVPEGVNKKICEKLGLGNAKILAPREGGKGAGSGMIGTLSAPMTELSFLKKIKSVMKAASLRHTAFLNKKVARVAVCGGSGSFLLEEAIRQKADVLLTADFKYHQFFDADSKLVIADIGHYETEQFTKELLRDFLMKKFPIFATPKGKGKNPSGGAEKKEKNIPLYISAINTNPIKYL